MTNMSGLPTSLPFVTRRARPRKKQTPTCFWSVVPTGDIAADQQRGATLAEQTIIAMSKDAFPPLLGWIARDQAESGSFDAVMVGFWHHIAECLLSNRRH